MSDEFKIRLDGGDEMGAESAAAYSEKVELAEQPVEAEKCEREAEFTLPMQENRALSVESELAVRKSALEMCEQEQRLDKSGNFNEEKEAGDSQKSIYVRLWIYILVTLFSFGICVLTPYSHLGITAFAAAQVVVVFTIPQWYRTKQSAFRTMLILTLVLMAVFPLLGGNMYFRAWNYVVAAGLSVWIVMETVGRLPLDEDFWNCVGNTFSLFFSAIGRMFRPFRWLKRGRNGGQGIVQRILLGLLIALPVAILLIWLLSAADSVFRWYLSDLLRWVAKLFTFTGVIKAVFSIAVALVLSQLLHTALCVAPFNGEARQRTHTDKGDILILGIVFGMICLIYSGFILIQFRYLFAQAELPFGMTYAEYARRGFFSLVVLSAVNVCIVLCVCRSLKNTLSSNSVGAGVMKFILWYLCAATAVLLVSAAYRMFLYDQAYGFTRQRLFVYLFLVLEAFLLLLTVLRVVNVRWRLARGYVSLFLCFWLALNLPGADALIAAKNIDRFEAGMNLDVKYLTSLSSDAAGQIARLKDVHDQADEHGRNIEEWVKKYFQNLKDKETACRFDWRTFNFSDMRAYRLAEEILDRNSEEGWEE